MTKVCMVVFLCLICGCTKQQFYRAYIYIINSCNVPLTVSVENSSQYIATPYTDKLIWKGGKGHFSLAKNERKLLADFTLAKKQEFIGYFNNPGDFSLDVSSGSKSINFSGRQIFQLLEKLPLKKDDSGDEYLELNDSSLCPL